LPKTHEKQRLASELDAAPEIQRSLMPHAAPAIEGYSIGFRSSACYEVGGDYLDIFALPSGEQVMIIADVAGSRHVCREESSEIYVGPDDQELRICISAAPNQRCHSASEESCQLTPTDETEL
jgi:hypothetical protein